MDTSYLSTQVTTIIGQLHGLFDEIGVPSHERQSRESELFTALSETLHNHLRQVTAEKNELTNEATQIIKTIKQMEASLEDRDQHDPYGASSSDFKVTLPLNACVDRLKEKQNKLAQVHRERFEQIKKLVQALESYSSHLEPSFLRVKLPPTNGASVPPTFDLSPSYIASLDEEFSRVYEEYNKRVSTAQGFAEEIVNLWAELGTPQAQTDTLIVKYHRDAPEQLGLHADEIKRLQGRRDRLLEEKRGRERKISDLKSTIQGLWDRLGVEESERKRFLAGNRGCGLRAINEFEAELDRLNELKRQNLHLFVEDARCKLQELWDGLYFSEEEMLEFAPAFSDVYSDALLSSHEAEIARLEALTEQRAPTLELINRHRSLVKDRDDLTAAAQDGSRLLAKNNKGEKRDPTRLLREEKMRKRIAKELPKIEADLKATLEHWEDEYGRPFLVHGESYLDELAAAAAKALPPRSRTPAGPPPGASMTKKVPLKAEAAPASSRAGSVLRNHPPSRPGTATPAGTMRRNAIPAPVSTSGKNKTPSKIPARMPLSTMQHGNNSPERKGQPNGTSTMKKQFAEYDTTTIRKMGPPARAPPPKMRELFQPPEPSSMYNDENVRCPSVASNGSGSVRQITPEDVYDDRERMSYVHTSSMHPQHSYAANMPRTQASSYSSHAAPSNFSSSRQISTTSSATTGAGTSGSENWETFDDSPSDRESEAYHQQHHCQSQPQQQYSHQHQHQYQQPQSYHNTNSSRGGLMQPPPLPGGKRYTPEGGHTTSPPGSRAGPAGKKFKALYGGGGSETANGHFDDGSEGGMVGLGTTARIMTASTTAGSESGWTDEEAF